MKVAVVGAGGAIGLPLVRQLVGTGHLVLALTKTTRRLDELTRIGAQSQLCDAFNQAQLVTVLAQFEPEVVINQLTAIPPRVNSRHFNRDFRTTNRLRTEGTKNLVRAATQAGARRIVAQSVVAVYAPGAGLRHEDDPAFLDAPTVLSEPVRAVLELESRTLEAPRTEGIVLRYGYFYGPGTFYTRTGSIGSDVLRRRIPVIGNGEGQLSFVHVEDAASATAVAIDSSDQGIFNITDDHPTPVHEWLPEYARLLGAPQPRRVPAWFARPIAGWYGVYYMTRQPAASNSRARSRLDWRPTYPNWRDGFAADLSRD